MFVCSCQYLGMLLSRIVECARAHDSNRIALMLNSVLCHKCENLMAIKSTTTAALGRINGMDVGMGTAGSSWGDSDVCGTVVRMVAGRECLHRQPCLVSVLLGSCFAMFVQRIGIAVVSRARLFVFSNR